MSRSSDGPPYPWWMAHQYVITSTCPLCRQETHTVTMAVVDDLDDDPTALGEERQVDARCVNPDCPEPRDQA
jgi:hypothetical protein